MVAVLNIACPLTRPTKIRVVRAFTFWRKKTEGKQSELVWCNNKIDHATM